MRIANFLSNLLQGLLLVGIVVLIAVGIRASVIVILVIPISILIGIGFIDLTGFGIQQMTITGMVIALGLLVDNAIVVTEGMLIRIQKGEDKLKSAQAVVGQNATPLLGATIVAVLAFASIGTSQDSTGEYCRSLFQVILISLMLSWLIAVTITPLFCYISFKPQKGADPNKDPYDAKFYHIYRKT